MSHHMLIGVGIVGGVWMISFAALYCVLGLYLVDTTPEMVAR